MVHPPGRGTSRMSDNPSNDDGSAISAARQIGVAAEELAGSPESAPADVVPFRLALRAWFAISLQTFGGPAGQIAVMQRELVDERRWIGPKRFQHALNYCMLLPG